ncbi:hypothetical protein [Polaribacter aestuariivivens]|uniref:hypothetical protein n=1 Tax=Polaribacter aestuariivivens TaxID=2304626 RepID=UPI003F492CE6
MNNETLQAPETKSEKVNQQLKLIEGKFTKREALSIINNVVDVKINFHKLQRLSKTEGNINDACKYDNSRITELIDDKADIKAFLMALETNKCNIKISSTINITVE